MLDARRTAVQLPLRREVTALQRIRTLQDPGTSSSFTSGGSSGAGKKSKKAKTFIGDPHRDAQALAFELSGKLVSDGARRSGTSRVEKLQRRRAVKAKEESIPEMDQQQRNEVDVRERIKRIESAFERSSTVTRSGELRKEGLIKELKAREADDLARSGDRWDRGRQERARMVVEEQRGSSFSSLAQLLGNHCGSGRSAMELLEMVAADNESLSDMEMEENPRPPPPLMSRGKDELKKPRAGRARTRKKPGKRTKSSTMRDPPPPATLLDDVHDWSRIHKSGGKAYLDLTGLGQDESEHLHNAPVQSISSLDSDANALPLIIGDDAQDSESDLEPERIPPKHPKRKASLQNAVKDVPMVASTSRHEADQGPRTLTQKYRPKSFREIVGQGVVVKSLSMAIMKEKVAPVYLFMGPRGTGKTSAARVFAAGLNCLLPDVGRRPCGLCLECIHMALNRSADVRQIDAAPDVDLQSMHAMMGDFTPQARYKVFIVEGCDLLSADIWNAFLKILEEPPRNVVFVLITTDADRIPATATSRCQKFLFSKLKESDIVQRLELLARKEGLVIEAGVLTLIAARSDGSLRDAEIILDQLCLLDKNVTVALVQELVGIVPDYQVLDLLDFALSANTVNTVRTLRELLNSGVEPLALVSQLGSLITDILVGSLEIDRDAPSGGFFSRNISAKEEQHRLRNALKILSDAEKQLRVATDRATWLTAALLQFAPDRSFFPSPDCSDHVSPTAPDLEITGDALNYQENDYDASDPEEEHLALSVAEFVESKKNASPDPSPEEEEEENVITISEQKLEEAWVGELPPPAQVDGEELAESQGAAEPPPVEFQVFQDEALAELWKRVVMELTPPNLKKLLQTHGCLVAAGVAVDGSCAVVELEFEFARDKHKAERAWRSICIAFQTVLSTAVELRIALSETAPDDADRTGETMVDMEPSPSAQKAKSKEVMDPHPDDAPPAPASRARPRRRGHKARRRHHRHSSEFVSSSDPSGITPRRPPSRTRKMKRGKAAQKPTITPTFEIESASTSFTREVWDSISGDRMPEKKALSTHMEEPLSEIEDLQSAQKKIMKHSSLAITRHGASLVNLQRGLPEDSALCWKKPSPQSDFLMRKSRVKSVRKSRGNAFLRLVPCRDTGITQHDAPAAAPVAA